MKPASSRAAAVVIVISTIAAFGRVCTHDFTWWDDNETVHHNPNLNPPTIAGILHYWDWRNPHMALYIPLTYTVWGGLAYMAQLQDADENGAMLNPWVFHSA